jgi:hypothetical protein
MSLFAILGTRMVAHEGLLVHGGLTSVGTMGVSKQTFLRCKARYGGRRSVTSDASDNSRTRTAASSGRSPISPWTTRR